MFSAEHIISIIIAVVLMVYLIKLLKNKPQKTIDNVLKITAVLFFLLNPINWIWEIYTYGAINVELNLPLHLCSLHWFLFPFAVFSKKQNAFKQIVYANSATIGLLGGAAGYLMNMHLNSNAFFSFPVLRSLLYHFLMVFAAFVLWFCKAYVPKKSDLFTYFIPVVVLVIACIYVDAVYGFEYCYVSTGKGTPFVILRAIMPRFLYVFVLYASIYIITSLIFYNKYILEYFNKKNVGAIK